MSAPWLNLGQILKVNASKYQDKLCLKDKSRSFSFSQTNQRVNKLANALLKAETPDEAARKVSIRITTLAED